MWDTEDVVRELEDLGYNVLGHSVFHIMIDQTGTYLVDVADDLADELDLGHNMPYSVWNVRQDPEGILIEFRPR